jgi:hypothetical protein
MNRTHLIVSLFVPAFFGCDSPLSTEPVVTVAIAADRGVVHPADTVAITV